MTFVPLVIKLGWEHKLLPTVISSWKKKMLFLIAKTYLKRVLELSKF